MFDFIIFFAKSNNIYGMIWKRGLFMKYCVNCGQAVKDSDAFCPFCGSPLAKGEELKVQEDTQIAPAKVSIPEERVIVGNQPSPQQSRTSKWNRFCKAALPLGIVSFALSFMGLIPYVGFFFGSVAILLAIGAITFGVLGIIKGQTKGKAITAIVFASFPLTFGIWFLVLCGQFVAAIGA